MAPFSYARRAILWRHNMVPFNGAILWHVCTRHKDRKSLILPTSPSFNAPALGNPQNFWMKLAPEKLEGWGYCMVKIYNPIFNRFCMIHPCDGRTDGRTGDTVAYTRYSIMLSRVKRGESQL